MAKLLRGGVKDGLLPLQLPRCGCSLGPLFVQAASAYTPLPRCGCSLGPLSVQVASAYTPVPRCGCSLGPLFVQEGSTYTPVARCGWSIGPLCVIVAFAFTLVMEPIKKIFCISFTTLLAEILEWYGLPEPLYKQYYKEKRRKYKVNVKIYVGVNTPSLKLHSKQFKDLNGAMQDAAQKAIQKLKEHHNFEVADYNLKGCLNERKKRRIADIKRVHQEMEFNCLKDYFFDECYENRRLKEMLQRITNLNSFELGRDQTIGENMQPTK